MKKAVHRINSPYDEYTPLHFAADRGAYDIMKCLLQSGADLLCKTENGKTPLYLALRYRRSSGILGILHDFLQVQKSPVEIKDHSFFHLVCVAGDLELIKHYLANGADPNCPSKRIADTMDNWTPLHMIAENCFSPAHEVAKLLIDYGANPNARDTQMNTPLHNIFQGSDLKVVDVLVNHGADVDALNANFETPLIVTCYRGDGMFDEGECCIVMKSLLKNGADINLADGAGKTPLTLNTWASFDGHHRDDDDDDEFDLRDYYNEEISLLLKHVIKLKMIGFYVSEINQQAYSSLLTKHSSRLNFNEANFKNQCIEELESIKKVGIDRYTTLHDMLFKDPNELAFSTRNDALQRIMESNDLENQFPIYGFMFPLQWRKGTLRRLLLEESLLALNSTVGKKLPSNCKEKMLQSLNNNDLKCIITCAKAR
ncbi:hypothetical protein QAD02_024063 [Eretmocerus hayati]|uniref:Uncharacterized protein n=1 Tax=Eretmocerus hayati TaxID=131215 RepID=A0ACC2PXQ7_9HYME|nr:hypothetical protein QAD02_024063 [Eretmocerus hayati]